MAKTSYTRVLIVLIVALAMGVLLYSLTPPDWPPGEYRVVASAHVGGETYSAEANYTLGPGSQAVTASGNGSVAVTLRIKECGSIAPGKKIEARVVVTRDGEPVELPLSNVSLRIVLPDGRSYTYYPVERSGGEYVFHIQPYAGAKLAGFVFGTAVALFAAASIVPYVITGLYATVALVILGIVSSKTAFSLYMSNVVLIFLAGSALELIIRNNGLDERVANLLTRLACSPYRLVIGATFLVSFLSMWMSNTAATFVVLPLVMAVLRKGNCLDTRYASILLASMAMAASVGGTATIIGTPPNAIAAEFLNDLVYHHTAIGFFEWLLIGLPAWLIGYLVGLGLALLYIRLLAHRELRELGEKLYGLRYGLSRRKPWSRRELLGLANILFLVTLWLLEPIHGLKSGIVGVIGLIVFFSTGALSVKEHWKQLAWDLMVLFGAGLTIGSSLMATGWAGFLLQHLVAVKTLGWASWLVIGFTAYMVGTFISSHTSASAFVAPLTIPLGMVLAPTLGLPVETGAALATIVAVVSLNNAVALPISTPPTAIVYSTGKVRMRDLVAYGLAYGVIANLLVITILTNYWINVLPH